MSNFFKECVLIIMIFLSILVAIFFAWAAWPIGEGNVSFLTVCFGTFSLIMFAAAYRFIVHFLSD